MCNKKKAEDFQHNNPNKRLEGQLCSWKFAPFRESLSTTQTKAHDTQRHLVPSE